MNKTITIDGITYVQQTSPGPWSYWIVDGGWIFIGKDKGISDGEQHIQNAFVMRKHRGGKGIGDIVIKNEITIDDANGDLSIPVAKIGPNMRLPEDWSPYSE